MLQGVSMGSPAQLIEGLGLIRVWICMDMHGYALDMHGGSVIYIYLLIKFALVLRGSSFVGSGAGGRRGGDGPGPVHG